MTVDALATPPELAALAYFLVAIGAHRLVAGARFLEARSLIGAVQAQRVRGCSTWPGASADNIAGSSRADNRVSDARPG